MGIHERSNGRINMSPNRAEAGGIAVAGMACVFPGAHGPEALWQDVIAGRRSFRKMPSERLPSAYYDPDPSAPDRTYIDQAAVIADWRFDPEEFRVPPVTVEVSEPTHWLALSVARAALVDAALDLERVDRTRAGVMIGNTLGGEFGRTLNLRLRWPYIERALRDAARGEDSGSAVTEQLIADFRRRCVDPIPEITEDTLAGVMSNTIAGRICNYYDLGGCGFTVDGACSSSLLAIAQACNALVSHELDLVLAGGVDISLDPFELVGFAKTYALAKDDIRPYDERAEGMLPGEGCGLVVLVREEDAERLQLRTRAVIRGWGISADGHGGITAPRLEGQLAALHRAYQRAGYPLSSVGLIEGHGTGTALGDKVEIEALLAEIGPTDRSTCKIGSIKANIGHCKAAAGAAGLIKAVMALERKVIPPTVCCDHPSSAFGKGPLAPALSGTAWESGQTPRRAAVSAFGFGGANAHITLEEVDSHATASATDLEYLASKQDSEVILISADGRQRLTHRLTQVARVASKITRAELTDLAAALARTDEQKSWRVAVVADSPWHLAERLDDLTAQITSGRSLVELTNPSLRTFAGCVEPTALPAPIVALFPGQASQRVGMGLRLAQRYPFVRTLHEQLDAVMADILPGGVTQRFLYDTREVDDETRTRLEAALKVTSIAQPAILVASLATLHVLASFGLTPDIYLGHSLGELVALCAAGAFGPEVAVNLAAMRGAAIAATGHDDDAMAAIASDATTVERLIKSFTSPLEISGINSTRQTIVAGSCSAVSDFIRGCMALRIAGQRLPVSHAFHSTRIAAAVDPFRKGLSGLQIGAPIRSVISTVTGRTLPSEVDVNALLIQHVTAPVHFLDAVLSAAQSKPALWVEVGPGAVLSGLVRDILGRDAASSFPIDVEGTDVFTQINAIAAKAFVSGLRLDAPALFAHRFVREFSIDTYAPRFIANPCEGQGASRPIATHELVSPIAKASATRPEVLAYVLQWIADRTGYARDAITEDMRLRDDLNLDSIKATELVQVLRSRFILDLPPQVGWSNAPIRELVDMVAAARTPAGEGSVAAEASVNGIVEGGDWVRSFAMRLEPAPLLREAAAVPLRLPSVFVVAPPGTALSQLTCNALVDDGFAPVLVEDNLDSSASPTVGSIVCFFAEADGTAVNDDVYSRAWELFRLARYLVPTGTGHPPAEQVIVVQPQPDPTMACAHNAGAGFFKSLALEYPHLRVKWLRVSSSISPDPIAQAIAAELRCTGPRVEYVYDAQMNRLTPCARVIEDGGLRPLLLGDRDVILASGGAKGITAELAQTIAKTTGARLALISRSTSDDNAVRRTLSLFAKAGITAQHWSCDVTNAGDVATTVRQIERTYGQVSAVLHGAGTSLPTSFSEATFERLWACIAPKAVGLQNLLAACPPSRLKAVHVVTSVLGHTGMLRQADYAFANAWASGAVAEIARVYPDLHALALGYSVWRGVGLGEKLGIVDLLAKLGITAVTVSDGTSAYQKLLRTRIHKPQLTITGRLAPALERMLFPGQPPQTSRFHERFVRWIPRVEAIAQCTITHNRDRYLRDHVVDGTPIIPAVLTLEAIVATAQAVAERSELPIVKDVVFRHPITVPDGAAVRLNIAALVIADDGQHISVYVAIRADIDDFAEDRVTARCDFSPTVTMPSIVALDVPLPSPIAPPRYADQLLFQGPVLRRLGAIRDLSPGVRCVADVFLSAPGDLFDADQFSCKTPYPAARDAFLQTILLLAQRPGVVTRIAEIRFLAVGFAGDVAVCRTCATDSSTYAIDVFAQTGEPIEMLRGVEARMIAPHRRFAGNTALPPASMAAALQLPP
jgi:enediyne polyketide synthase